MYQSKFSEGAVVKIANKHILEQFRETWTFHHPLGIEQVRCADQKAIVQSVGYYHGGDVLYQLTGIAGMWHESCLLPDQVQ